RLTGRTEDQIALVEAYAKEQGMWLAPGSDDYIEPEYSEYLELDLATVVPSIAGPKRPQDSISVTNAKKQFRADLKNYVVDGRGIEKSSVDEELDGTFPASDPLTLEANGGSSDLGKPIHSVIDGSRGRATKLVTVTEPDGNKYELDHGRVAIASITSCTNTSNPEVLLAAGRLGKNAAEKGVKSKPWVKTSRAPGSQVVTNYYNKAGLWPFLEDLGFHLVGYGCTTCIGNAGPLPDEVSEVVNEHDLAVVSVLSGNRNFEGRINPDVKMNYLASPPLVIAYALAGTMDFDFENEPLGHTDEGEPVYLKDIWPSTDDVQNTIKSSINREMFTEDYADVFAGDDNWRNLDTPEGEIFEWDADSTYVRKPPYFEGMGINPEPVTDISGARVLAKLGDSVTTDHI